MVTGAFILQGAFLGAIYGQNPSYLSERFPTEVRATASGFCYHQGAIWGGLTPPLLTYFAITQPLGFTIPMLISTSGAAIVFVTSCCSALRRRARAPRLGARTGPIACRVNHDRGRLTGGRGFFAPAELLRIHKCAAGANQAGSSLISWDARRPPR